MTDVCTHERMVYQWLSLMSTLWFLFFFFQAEDGIRDLTVTGVQTCALPILTGTGDPVVLVPGLFGSAFGYRAVIPLLTDAGYRAIVVEPLGIGSSARPEHADYSLTAQADRIAAALDRLGVRHAVVVAHSLGASMAFRLAYRRPDLVAGIVSLDGGPAEAAATRAFRRAMKLAPWIRVFGGVKLIRKKIRGQLIKASGDSSWVSEQVVDGYTAAAAHDLEDRKSTRLNSSHSQISYAVFCLKK